MGRREMVHEAEETDLTCPSTKTVVPSDYSILSFKFFFFPFVIFIFLKAASWKLDCPLLSKKYICVYFSQLKV